MNWTARPALPTRPLDRTLGAGLLPDPLLRVGSRAGAHARLRREERGGVAAQEERLGALLARMRSGPIAEQTAERQRAALRAPAGVLRAAAGPASEVFERAVERGRARPRGRRGGDAASHGEAVRRSPTGCASSTSGAAGGPFSFYVCERFPGVRVLAVSNSATPAPMD